MKKWNWIAGLLLLCASFSGAQSLKYRENGKFKLVQFTDVHYIHQDARATVALERMKQVLEAEKPDLVVFTGDLIYGKPAEESLRTVLDLVAAFKLPFAVTFGNHDDEQGMSRQELFKIIQSVPGNLTTTTQGLPGVTNYYLPIHASSSDSIAEVLYFFDSHSYSHVPGVGGYDYIKQEQIQWYQDTSRQLAEKQGNRLLPALAFFHIPLPEYNQAASNEAAPLFGCRKEKACAPQLNSGLFTAFKQTGDVQGVFVGHDHDNDYAVMWHGILLAYGRYTGGHTVYSNLPNGARVIELTEGEKGFRTWIRLNDQHTEQEVVFPDSFLKPNR
ncbi:metallophosphoesterase [gut metagenome]|uniref:Metallophosphoesterase n=1 Tax=gut metagenome TaxID=749906 RepID=J9D407_9ZZZZ